MTRPRKCSRSISGRLRICTATPRCYGRLERDRHPVQPVDGDRFLAALDLADELAGETGAITQPLLAESALVAERP